MDLHGNPQGEYGRFEQILSQFLLKSLHIILDSRVPSIRSYGHTREVKKSDKWFNMVLGDRPAALDNLNFWHRNLMEPMIIDIILVQDKANSSAKQYSGTTLGDTFTETVIERWVVQYEHPRSLPPQVADSSYKKTYKKLIILLRSLYSMTRLLPAYKAFRKLSSSQSCDFDLNYKVSSFTVPFSRAEEPLIKHYSFIPVDAQHGCFSLSLTYRENLSDFNLETSACFPPEIITDYVGSPLADPMRSFPSTSSEKGVRATSYPLRRSQTSTSGPFQRPHSWTSGLHKGPSLAQNEHSLGSPPLYRSPYDLSSPPVNVHGRRTSNYRVPTHHRTTSSEDYQLSPPFSPFSASPSPSLSPPTHVSHGNPALSRLSSETSPVNIPHQMTSRNSGFPSPNFSDPNRHSLPPQSPRSIKHDSSHHEFPTGIRSLKKSDSTRAGESSSGTANLGLKVLRDAKDDSGRFSGLHSSSGSPRIEFSRSSSRLSFPDDLDDCDFSCPFVVDDVDSQASQNLDAKKDSESPSQTFLGTRKSQDAAVGALIQMLKTAPPLCQDSSCYSPCSVKNDPEGEIGTSSGFSAPRKISDAMEDLRAYKELKDLLLSKSAAQSVRKAD